MLPVEVAQISPSLGAPLVTDETSLWYREYELIERARARPVRLTYHMPGPDDADVDADARARARTWLSLDSHNFELEVEPEVNSVLSNAGRSAVSLICVQGDLGVGKSYLMNTLAQQPGLFGVSAGSTSSTIGAWLSPALVSLSTFAGSRPADVPAAGGPLLGFVDMEGQGDRGLAYDIKLATPLLVVSHVVLLYFQVSTRLQKEVILNKLAVLGRAAGQIIAGVDDGESAARQLGHVHVVLRDCTHSQLECEELLFDPEPLGDTTGEQLALLEERNATRVQVRTRFSSAHVWCLPPLTLSRRQRASFPADYRELSHPDHGHEDNQEYVDKIDELRECLAGQLRSERTLGGAVLTGTTIAQLMPRIREELARPHPSINPISMVEAAHELEAGTHLEAETARVRATCDEIASELEVGPLADDAVMDRVEAALRDAATRLQESTRTLLSRVHERAVAKLSTFGEEQRATMRVRAREARIRHAQAALLHAMGAEQPEIQVLQDAIGAATNAGVDELVIARAQELHAKLMEAAHELEAGTHLEAETARVRATCDEIASELEVGPLADDAVMDRVEAALRDAATRLQESTRTLLSRVHERAVAKLSTFGEEQRATMRVRAREARIRHAQAALLHAMGVNEADADALQAAIVDAIDAGVDGVVVVRAKEHHARLVAAQQLVGAVEGQQTVDLRELRSGISSAKECGLPATQLGRLQAHERKMSEALRQLEVQVRRPVATSAMEKTLDAALPERHVALLGQAIQAAEAAHVQDPLLQAAHQRLARVKADVRARNVRCMHAAMACVAITTSLAFSCPRWLAALFGPLLFPLLLAGAVLYTAYGQDAVNALS